MTTIEDWKFRADYLRDYARFLRAQAEDYKTLAVKYDQSAEHARREYETFSTTRAALAEQDKP